MKAETITSTPKWKPDITYTNLFAVVMHNGGRGTFMKYIADNCKKSLSGNTAIRYGDTRMIFAVGQFEYTMRVRIPAELHREEVFTKPLAVFVATVESGFSEYRFCTAEQFSAWLNDCL